MPQVPFAFRTQAAQVDFQGPPGLVARLHASFGSMRGEILNLNHVASKDERVILQSPTGSTQVELVHGRLALQTQLFADFVKPAEGAQRADYMRAKLGYVLPLLEREGASLQYLGVSTDARLSVSTVGNRAALHRAATAAAGLRPDLTEGQPCFDFTLRVSRVVDDLAFSNVILQWYQDRSVTMQMIDPTQMAAARFAMWDLPLTDEGLQFQYDRNNKAGLYAGRRAWTATEFISMASAAIEAAPAALASVAESVSASLSAASVNT